MASRIFNRISPMQLRTQLSRQKIETALCWMLVAAVVVQLVLIGDAHAQTGGGIFKKAACDLLGQVLTKDFGAMVTVVAGVLAIVASVTGSFKGAWALVFVSVGCFIYPYLVQTAFGIQC